MGAGVSHRVDPGIQHQDGAQGRAAENLRRSARSALEGAPGHRGGQRRLVRQAPQRDGRAKRARHLPRDRGDQRHLRTQRALASRQPRAVGRSAVRHHHAQQRRGAREEAGQAGRLDRARAGRGARQQHRRDAQGAAPACRAALLRVPDRRRRPASFRQPRIHPGEPQRCLAARGREAARHRPRGGARSGREVGQALQRRRGEPPPVTVTRTRTRTWVGQAVQRVEDERLLRGEGQYIADLQREGMLHAVVLRSPVAHGVLKRIDAAPARAMAGVRAVITAADIERALGRLPKIPLRQDAVESVMPFLQPVIANGKVRYVGEPIAVIVADTRAQAEDALDAITLDIDALPAVADTDAADKASSRLFDDQPVNCALVLAGVKGDGEAAFANAPYRRRERFTVHRHTAVPMETRGVLAEWDREKTRVTVWGATKAPFLCRRILAPLFGMPEADISMVEGDTGGSFGVRGEFYPDDFLIPFAARELGRAVKWIETRSEHFLSCNHSREADCEIEIACEKDGTIVGMRARARTDVGAYVRTNGVTPSRNMAQVSTGPYRIPNVRFEVAMMLTNKTPVGTYRGPGRFETDFFRERLFDIAARELGIDRVEFRRRNLVSKEEMPYPLPTIEPTGAKSECDSGNYRSALERCLDDFRWAEKAKLNGKLIDGRYHGIALGCYIEGGASGPREGARIVLNS